MQVSRNLKHIVPSYGYHDPGVWETRDGKNTSGSLRNIRWQDEWIEWRGNLTHMVTRSEKHNQR